MYKLFIFVIFAFMVSSIVMAGPFAEKRQAFQELSTEEKEAMKESAMQQTEQAKETYSNMTEEEKIELRSEFKEKMMQKMK